MYCNNCGKEIDDRAYICTHCGVKTKSVSQYDEPIGGLGVLCFFSPVIGLILYLIWKEEKPVKSKGAGNSALWGISTSVVLYLLIMVIVFASASY